MTARLRRERPAASNPRVVANSEETPTEYATDLRRLLQRVVGTPQHHAEIQGRLETFAKEITARALAEAVDVVAAGAARLHIDEPTPTDELRRWRQALEAVADGLGAIEAAVTRGDDIDLEESVEWPDLRTTEPPRRGVSGAETSPTHASVELQR